MIIQSTIRPNTPSAIKVMVRKHRLSPSGGYIHTGLPIGAGISGEILFWHWEPQEGLTEVPPWMVIDIEEDKSKPQDETDKDRAKRQGELPMEMVTTGTTGALFFTGIHVADAVGAPFVGRVIATASNAGSDQVLVDATTKVIRDDMALLPSWLGDVLKLLVLAGTLFGLGFKLLEMFFGKQRPTWAIVLMCIVNFSLISWAAMAMFGWGPYAPSPSP
jgi:hypothetical protein